MKTATVTVNVLGARALRHRAADQVVVFRLEHDAK